MSYLEIAKKIQARLREDKQGRIGPPQLTSFGPDHPDFLDMAARLSQMDISTFQQGDYAISIAVDWLDGSLWLCPTETEANILASEGTPRSHIWTVRELRDLMSIPGLDLEGVRSIQVLKDEFGGHLAEVRQIEPKEKSAKQE